MSLRLLLFSRFLTLPNPIDGVDKNFENQDDIDAKTPSVTQRSIVHILKSFQTMISLVLGV